MGAATEEEEEELKTAFESGRVQVVEAMVTHYLHLPVFYPKCKALVAVPGICPCGSYTALLHFSDML